MEEEINLLDYWRVMVKRKELIIIPTCVAIIVAVFVSLSLPKIYKAETTVLLPQRGGGVSGALASLAGFSISLPIDLSGALGRTTNYVDILGSYSLAEMVVEGLDLKKEFPKIKKKDDLIKTIQGSVKAKEQKGIITISVENQDPRLAADVANYYALALDRFNQRANLQVATRTRIFIREQLEKAKADLNLAEDRLKRFQTEVTLVKEKERELALGRLMRDVKIKEGVYTLLSQEYEKAKIEEAKEGQFFEILDPAYPPKIPSKPRVKLNIAIAGMLGLFTGIFLAFFSEYLEGLGFKAPK